MIPEYFAYFCILFGLIGYYHYIKDTIYGNTKPNLVSWTLWVIAPFVGIYINYESGISIPLLLSTFMAGFGPLLVIIASFFNKNSYWKITKIDILCGVLSFIAIIIWITMRNATLSLIFAILADLFAGIPTIIKSWRHSDTETASTYFFGIVNQIITIFIITNFSFQNLGFPVYLILINFIIVLGIKKNIFKTLLVDSISRNK